MPPTHATRTRRLVTGLAGLLLLATGLAGCAATHVIPGHPQRVAWRDYRSGIWLELVNETHTGRVEQYSETRKDASRKVQTDEIVAALIDVMRRDGFAAQAKPGPAPRGSDGQTIMALEIDDNGVIEHVVAWRGMPADKRVEVLSLAQNFAELYNATYGLQSVELTPGERPFESPTTPKQIQPLGGN